MIAQVMYLIGYIQVSLVMDMTQVMIIVIIRNGNMEDIERKICSYEYDLEYRKNNNDKKNQCCINYKEKKKKQEKKIKNQNTTKMQMQCTEHSTNNNKMEWQTTNQELKTA